MGRFGPVALCLAALALVSMGLIAWSHLGWRSIQERSHAFDSQLSAVQFRLHRSQWLLEEALRQPESTEDEQLISRPLNEARQMASGLAMEDSPRMQGSLTQWMQDLQRAESAVRKRWRQPADTSEASVRDALAQLDGSSAALGQAWASELELSRQRQSQLDKINMALVGGLTLVLLSAMWHAHRQRERALNVLRKREAQLRAFADALPDLAFRLDHEGRHLDIYGNNLPLLGRPPEAWLGRRLHEFFAPDMAERLMSTLRAALSQRKTQTSTFALEVNGQMRHFDSRCAPVGDSNEAVWMIWDITSRRQTERRLRRKTRMYDFLSHVNQAIVRSQEEAALLARVCQVAVEHGQFRKAWVAYFDPAAGQAGLLTLTCQADAGDPAPTLPGLSFSLLSTPANEAVLDRSLREGRTYRTSDLGREPLRPAWADEAMAAGTPGCVVVPLHRDQALIGHLILLGKRVDDHDADELGLFEDLSSDLSFALTTLHREELRNHAEQRIRLHAAALESSRDGMMVLGRDRRLVSINPAFTALTGYDEHEVIGRSPEFLLPEHPEETIESMRRDIIEQGTCQTEVWFQKKSGELFMTKLSVSTVSGLQGQPTHFVGVFTDITQLKQTEERLARMAHFDTLTELPNRMMIHQRLAHAVNLAQRHHTLVGVVFIDLDNFKTVNDGLGHAAGDSLLRQVAQRLRQRVRQEDTLGRLGGDEFILVLEHLRHPQQAAQVATAILETLGEPFTLDGGQQVYVRASIGIALFPEDGVDAAELVRNADAAMYESKRRGRNNFSFYTSTFTTDANSRLLLETRLRRAVELGEFVLHYQPMVRISDHRVVAVEALVRLKAPQGSDDPPISSIGPNEFIPVMEDTGMIVALGDWVLAEACRQAKAWLDAGLEFGRIAVNVSPSEISRGAVLDRLTRILEETGLPPNCLELEITESGLMESGPAAEAFLQSVHALGVHLTIDDFGTGYSSLAYLKRFPVQQLKIDRSFVQDLPGQDSDNQLVSTMIAMAHGLRLQVVAEGVEMPDQEAYLASLGCDVAQGYLHGRPQSAEQITPLLKRH